MHEGCGDEQAVVGGDAGKEEFDMQLVEQWIRETLDDPFDVAVSEVGMRIRQHFGAAMGFEAIEALLESRRWRMRHP